VRRIGLAQLELAEQRLKGTSDPVTAVHEARKSLKRTRALLRLARRALGETVYRRENRQLRDAGRLLSSARDADVMRETLAKLEARLSDNRKACVVPLRELLNGAGAHVSNSAVSVNLRKAKVSIGAAKKRFARLKAKTEGFDQLAAGLQTGYRLGRRALAHAEDGADEEAFHELRKAVQQHWRQMLLLTRAWPEVCRARAAAARDIAQLLGEEHDYAILAAYIVSQRDCGLTAEELEVIAQACRDRQHELRALALPMARRLFSDRAGPFARRMEKYWSIARDLAKLEAGHDKDDD
jgi:CHAD domain-containing protein